MHLTLRYVVLICHEYDVCKNSVGSVYVGLSKTVLTAMISGDYVCCSVEFGTLVGVFVFSVMWSEMQMTSAISCPL